MIEKICKVMAVDRVLVSHQDNLSQHIQKDSLHNPWVPLWTQLVLCIKDNTLTPLVLTTVTMKMKSLRNKIKWRTLKSLQMMMNLIKVKGKAKILMNNMDLKKIPKRKLIWRIILLNKKLISCLTSNLVILIWKTLSKQKRYKKKSGIFNWDWVNN